MRADRREVDLHPPGQPLRFGQRELIVHAGREAEGPQRSPIRRGRGRDLYDEWKSMISGKNAPGTCRRRVTPGAHSSNPQHETT